MSRFWIALGESVLHFHGQIEPMCFIMPDTIACCLSHVTGNFRPTFGFRFVMSSRALSPGRFTARFAFSLLSLPRRFWFFCSRRWMIIACRVHGNVTCRDAYKPQLCEAHGLMKRITYTVKYGEMRDINTEKTER